MKKLFALLLALIMVVSMAACGAKNEAAAPAATDAAPAATQAVATQPVEEGAVKTMYAVTGPSEVFEIPWFNLGPHTWVKAMYETLIGMDAKGNPTTNNGLAAEYTYADDGLSASVTLRDGLKWHDGEPITAEDKAIFGIMRDSSITKLESYGTWSVNITAENVAKYNEEGLEGTTAGPVEIWSDTLQFLFTLKLSEIDVTAGAGEEGYNVFFDLYFKPYDAATEKDGGYSVATIQAWSVYKDTGSDFAIYRCDFGDTKLMDLEEGKYTVQIVVREGELVKGWCTATNFVWTDSCVAFVNYAKNHPDEVTITK